jgi:hypothetical protein
LRKKAELVKKRFGHGPSWRKTVSLLAGLYRTGLFDRHGKKGPDGLEIKSIVYRDMLAPGRVLIFDIHGVDSPQHRNLAISDLLRGVMEAQDQLYVSGLFRLGNGLAPGTGKDTLEPRVN